jgi:hypothetical protein
MGPPEGYASNNDIRGFQVHLALSPAVAHVDELDGPFNNCECGHIARRAHLQRAKFGDSVNYLRRINGRHSDHLLQREAMLRNLLFEHMDI